MHSKKCSTCNEVKSVSEFHKDKRNKKDGLQSRCKSCKAKWHTANKERISKYHVEYYQANKGRIREYQAEYYQANKERVLTRNAEYTKANKERVNKYKAEWYEANKERMAECNAEWQKNNKDRVLAISARRRALKKNAYVDLTESEKLSIKLMYEDASIIGWHVDHIVPLSKGGLHHPDNLQIVPPTYNLKKQDKHFQDRKYI